MVAATARRAVLPALLALAALLALPNAASAALNWGSCVDFRGVRCATLNVPLDRAGIDPGTVDAADRAAPGKTSGPTLMYLSGGPGGAGVSEMLERRQSELPRARGPLPADRLRPARHRPLRAAALPAAGAGPAPARHRGGRGVREPARRRRAGTTRPRTRSQDMEAIRPQLGVEKLTLFGISYGTELAIAYARAYPQHVERLILDSVVDPDDPDPYFTVDASAPWARRCGRSARAAAAGSAPTPAATSASSSRSCAPSRWRAFAYDALRALAQGHDQARWRCST